jgi:uncharacterized protein YqgC (DUF456 family)
VTLLELLVGLAIVVGILGILLPVLPGSLLILGAVLVWAVDQGSNASWVVFALVTVLLVVGAIVKYVVPGRNLRATGVPNRSLVAGGLLGIAGFFVVPVLGLVLGFVLGVYLAETQRVGRESSGASTRAALRAVGLSILIELLAGLLAATAWLTGALVT